MEKHLKQIADLVREMGWAIALPNDGLAKDDDNVHGMIIGESAYVDYILGCLKKNK